MTFDGPPLDPEDVGEFFLAMMPWLALPNPYGHLALPGVRAPARAAVDARPVVEMSHAHVFMEANHAPSIAAAAAAAAAAGTAADDDVSASPWDPGFDPPKTGLRRGPEPEGPDPRSLSLNRPRRPTGTQAAVRVAAPTAPPPKPRAPAASEASHDILILPQNPSFKAADQGVTAVLTYLRTAQMLMPRVRHDTPEGIVVELSPDVFVHQIFVQGQAPAGPPAIREATLRVWRQPSPVSFGPAGRASCFALELIGCRFPQVLEAFKARLHQIVYLRPEVHVVPHDPARLRAGAPAAAQPIPAFDLQEVDRG